MGKMIVENRSTISDCAAMGLCVRVMQQGRISNDDKQYCYATRFVVTDHGAVMVATVLNKKSDKFVVYNDT